jgi:hypothetical protein
MLRSIAALSIFCLGFSSSLWAQEEDATEEKDSSAGLPKEYVSKYLIASSTLSPDKNMAVIYPKDSEDEKAKDYLVTLKPFKILTPLATDYPYFANESHGSISAEWSKDNSVALVTLESKWGPGDVFLYEIHDGKVSRATDLLKKISDLLRPDYEQAKPEPYNDNFPFIFDDDMLSGGEADSSQPVKQCALDGAQQVKVKAAATTDPKQIGGIKAWDAKFEGVWDIPQAKFTSEKVTRVFAGVRKDD